MTKSKSPFRLLVEAALCRGLRSTERPRPLDWLVQRCRGVSRTTFHNNMSGVTMPHNYTMARYAAGMRVPVADVRAALEATYGKDWA